MYNFLPLAIQKDAILVGIVAFALLMGAPNNEKKNMIEILFLFNSARVYQNIKFIYVSYRIKIY